MNQVWRTLETAIRANKPGPPVAALDAVRYMSVDTATQRPAGRRPSSQPEDGQDGQDEGVLAAARRAAASHQAAHGQPITRDALRARLGISTQAASDLLRQLRASDPALPPAPARLDQTRRAPADPQP